MEKRKNVIFRDDGDDEFPFGKPRIERYVELMGIFWGEIDENFVSWN